MNDRPHTVIGVLPPVPLYPQECDVYMPTIACPFRARGEEQMAANRRAFAALEVFGRLKPGVAPEHAGDCRFQQSPIGSAASTWIPMRTSAASSPPTVGVLAS